MGKVELKEGVSTCFHDFSRLLFLDLKSSKSCSWMAMVFLYCAHIPVRWNIKSSVKQECLNV